MAKTKAVVKKDVVKNVETLPQAAKVEAKEILATVEATAPVGKRETEEEKNTRVIRETVKAVVGELVPAMMAMQVGNQSSSGSRPANRPRFHQCGICKQSGPPSVTNPLGFPCRGEHVKMVVYPTKYPEFGKWFQGCIINGIRYLSSNRRERIDIPKECEGQIMKQVADYEENERVTAMGRTAEHNSGSMNEGGGGKQNHANSAWR